METTKTATAEAITMYFVDVLDGKAEFNPEHIAEVLKAKLGIDAMPSARKLAVELFAAALDAAGKPDLARNTLNRFGL